MSVAQEDLNAKVLGVEEVADHRKCFTIERPAGFDFEAGQHMYVETRPDWGAPFTIVSVPGDGHLAFTTVMRDASPLKKELGELSPGDTVIVSGPYGEFTRDEGEEKTGMIAGGIGITPFISILHDIEARGLVADAVLLYSSRRRSDTSYREELEPTTPITKATRGASIGPSSRPTSMASPTALGTSPDPRAWWRPSTAC
jgi:ferredoxin-NADP reductase